MAQPDKNEARFKRARDKAGQAAEKTRTAISWAAALALGAFLFIAGTFPYIAGLGLQAIGWLAAAIAAATIALGAWMRRSSDEPREKAAWAAVVTIGVLVALFLIGGI